MRKRVKNRNGVLSCMRCKSLVCVIIREKREDKRLELIEYALLPEPADDVTRVLCASCARIIWTEE